MIDLEKNEQILLSARRHWFFLFAKIFPLLPLAGIPVFIAIVLSILGKVDPAASNLAGMFYRVQGGSSAFVIFILISWFLFLWIAAFVIWTDYYLDVLIVTDHRVINVEQKGLFKRETSSLHLDKIQDVSVDISGMLATFLSFGRLRIQTASEVGEFTLNGIKDPIAVKNLILEQHEKAMTKLRTVRIEQ